MKPIVAQAVLGLAVGALGLSMAVAQTPRTPPAAAAAPAFKNLKVLPQTISRPDLIAMMKRFTVALGVRCTHCHVGEEGKPLSTYDFASDKKANKAIARDMMRMIHRLNTRDLPAIGGLTEPRITCYTCHRGAKEPARTPPAA